MVPEESITQNEGYTYGKGISFHQTSSPPSFSLFLDNKERITLPPAPMISEFDPSRAESNEEFIVRLKHMGKSER